MTLFFASLGSGSRGNATLVRSGNTLLLVDNGFTLKETEARLQRLGFNADQLSAILVTHEHGDHIKGVGPLARKYQLPVYATHGTLQGDPLGRGVETHSISPHRHFPIEDIEVTPVAVPHDAREPCQFVFNCGGARVGLLTDLGSITPFVIEQYRDCDALMLECNHDPGMLSMGPYPPSLKQRVGGLWGHLSNQQAAGLLERITVERLQHLVISHISEMNNTELLAREAIAGVCESPPLHLATQALGIDWLEVVAG